MATASSSPFAAPVRQRSLAAVPAAAAAAAAVQAHAVRALSRKLSDALNAVVQHRVSGPQGQVRPFTIVADEAAWKAADWEGRKEEAMVTLSAQDADNLRAAVAAFEAGGTPLASIRTPKDFPLPEGLAAKLAQTKADLLHGRGFALLRGLPVADWTERQCIIAYMGLGVYIGRPQPQSKDGKLVNHVKMHHAQGGAKVLPQREHAHNLEFGVHTDAQADVLGLLCIQQAKEGGVSSFASTLAVHNEIIARGRYDLLHCLTGAGWYRDRARYQDLPSGASPLWEMPVFAYHGGYLTTHYNSSHYRVCEKRYPEQAGALTPLQLEALATFEAIANDPAFSVSYRLAPGDVILLHNSSTLHARSAFKDGDAPHERRHLVRLWLGCADDRPQPPHLNFPRAYTVTTNPEYDPAAFDGLMRPDPATFHVPLSAEADDV